MKAKWNGMDTKVSGLFFAGAGGPSSTTMYDKFCEALEKVDFIVTADVAMSDMARMSDIVLPVAHQFECEGTYGAQLEAEAAYFEQVVEPAFESKTDVEIAIGLARALGLGEYFPENHHEFVIEYVSSHPDFLATGITYERLTKEYTIRYRKKGSWYADGYPTPTGRVEFYLENPQPRLVSNLPLPEDPEHLPTWVEPYEAWPTKESSKKYPIAFIYQRNHFRFHNIGFDGEWANDLEMGPTARINPDDAGERGIKDGDMVEFLNDRGRVVMKTYLDTGVKRGVAIYDSKGLRKESYAVGHPIQLMQPAYEPFAVNMALFDCTCEMSVWDGRE